MKVNCLYDKLVPVSELVPHPKNRNKHPEKQVERLAKILEYQGWRYPVKVSKQTGFVTSGHGRLMAALKAGWPEVPVNYQDYENEDQEYADLIADNAIAEWSDLDLSGINLDVPDLGPEFDLDWLGLVNFKVDPSELDDPNYSTKIESPVYTPKGDKPKLEDCYDLKKMSELTQEILRSNIPEDMKQFLIYAAYRHIVFNYENIAELYCHVSKEEQVLMEKSALVIIDFNKAIENGFLKLTKDISEAAGQSE